MSDLNPIIPELTEKVILTIRGEDQIYEFDQLGITFDSPEREILTALDGVIRESNITIRDENGDGESGNEFTFTVRKSTNTRLIHVYPKDPAGGGEGNSEKEKEVYLTIEIKECDWNAIKRCFNFNTPNAEFPIFEIKEKTTK